MRIWSIHPKYLDSKGLVALWRETLLAQNVLLKKTTGYKNHPQLNRFKSHPKPLTAISNYLQGVYEEAKRRGYNFNKSKISLPFDNVEKITVTRGQLIYELNHLRKKLETRDFIKYEHTLTIAVPESHQLFNLIEGTIESWEVVHNTLQKKN